MWWSTPSRDAPPIGGKGPTGHRATITASTVGCNISYNGATGAGGRSTGAPGYKKKPSRITEISNAVINLPSPITEFNVQYFFISQSPLILMFIKQIQFRVQSVLLQGYVQILRHVCCCIALISEMIFFLVRRTKFKTFPGQIFPSRHFENRLVKTN